MVLKLDVERPAHGVETVIREFWEKLFARFNGVHRQVFGRPDTVVGQRLPEYPGIKRGVMRDDEPIALEERGDVLPHLRELRCVGYVSGMNTVNLDVAPEKVGFGFDQRVKLVDHLIIANDCEG